MLTEKPRPIRSTRAQVPDYVEATVQRALEKLPADRFSTVREYADGLQGRIDFTGSQAFTSARQAASPRSTWTRRLKDPLVLGLAALSIASLGFAAYMSRDRTPAQRPIRFVLATPDSARAIDNYPWPGAISPDGSTIVYSANVGGTQSLFVQRTDQLDARIIQGTTAGSQPIFSPDGQWVAFEAQGKLKKVRLDGSAPISVTDAGSDNGGDWSARDEIILGSDGKNRGLSKVSASGGELVEFAKPVSTNKESDYVWPVAFPDGKRVAFTIWYGTLASSKIATASVDDGKVEPLGLKGIRPLAVIDRTLVYVQVDGQVMGVKLDRSGRKLAGKPAPVLDPVFVQPGLNGNSNIFVSSGGALLTARGGTRSQLAWMTPDGATKVISKETRDFASPRLSPDGSRIAVTVGDQDKSAIWIYDLATTTFSSLSTVEGAMSPSWTSDGKRVVYAGRGEYERSAVWSQNADGGSAPVKLFDVDHLVAAASLSPDNGSVIYSNFIANDWQVSRVSLDAPTVISTYIKPGAGAVQPSFSPDGKWVALTSFESGQSEIYVRSYPDPSARVQISAGGGNSAAWSADGTRVLYRKGSVLMSAKLSTAPSLRVLSRDTVLLSAPSATNSGLTRNYDVAKDGRILALATNKNDFELVIVPNWLPELRERLSGKK
jgi:serine/threonine-protein kinase